MKDSQIKLEIEYRQDSDCMQSDSFGQTLIVKTETDGVLPGHYFIIETERWAFDEIDELIAILKDFKSKYNKLNTTKP